MNRNEAYALACRYQGRRVCITDQRGNQHNGRITKVDQRMVWIMPDNDLGGFGMGFWGFGRGFGYGIALGVITGIALTSLFFF